LYKIRSRKIKKSSNNVTSNRSCILLVYCFCGRCKTSLEVPIKLFSGGESVKVLEQLLADVIQIGIGIEERNKNWKVPDISMHPRWHIKIAIRRAKIQQ